MADGEEGGEDHEEAEEEERQLSGDALGTPASPLPSKLKRAAPPAAVMMQQTGRWRGAGEARLSAAWGGGGENRGLDRDTDKYSERLAPPPNSRRHPGV